MRMTAIEMKGLLDIYFSDDDVEVVDEGRPVSLDVERTLNNSLFN